MSLYNFRPSFVLVHLGKVAENRDSIVSMVGLQFLFPIEKKTVFFGLDSVDLSIQVCGLQVRG